MLSSWRPDTIPDIGGEIRVSVNCPGREHFLTDPGVPRITVTAKYGKEGNDAANAAARPCPKAGHFPTVPALDETAVTRAELPITFAKFFRLTVA
jgi:hypothetical protein